MRFTLPLVLFLCVIIVLWRGLSLHPNQLPSPLIDKPAPVFQLPVLSKGTVSNKIFLGKVSLLNVWATWCEACAEEHEFLLRLANDEHIVIYGLNYKDDPLAAKKWLTQYGNPYQTVAIDRDGTVAIDWGVYGTPETFVIDKKGVVRYKHIGVVTAEVWEQKLKPLMIKLEKEE